MVLEPPWFQHFTDLAFEGKMFQDSEEEFLGRAFKESSSKISSVTYQRRGVGKKKKRETIKKSPFYKQSRQFEYDFIHWSQGLEAGQSTCQI